MDGWMDGWMDGLKVRELFYSEFCATLRRKTQTRRKTNAPVIFFHAHSLLL